MTEPSETRPAPRVAMVASDCLASRVLFHALDDAFGVSGVVLEAPVDRTTLIKHRVKRVGALKTAGQLVFIGGIAPVLDRRGRRRVADIVREAALDDAPIPRSRIVSVGSVNDRASIEAVRGFRPDVVVVAGTRIISAQVLSDVGVPFVNLHAGITPRYRGVHGGYWAFAEGRPADAGVTVHVVDAGIDTGTILARATIAPTQQDTFATYFALQLAVGVPLLVATLPAVARGQAPTLEGSGPSVLRYHPTAWEYLRYRTKGIR